jgi:poly-gamma-glutamate synthesis protein (capsule biosynthesis protein)
MGGSDIITTNKTWNLSKGNIAPDNGVIDAILGSNLAQNDENAFIEEHGIKNILPDIFEYFPDRKIVPIIIKPETKDEQIDRLSSQLQSACDNKCFLLSSVDFSHYQPGSLAEIHDNLSIRALQTLDEDSIKRTEVIHERPFA